MAGIEPGQIIDGRYRVLSRLGAGGMADVYLAEDEQLQRQVALKLLHHRFAADPGFVERFRREAQSAASLQHPNVVSVYDRGSYDDTYYIAMEYLQGRTLKQVIREEAPLDPVRAIDITLQILKAARFAHRRGVIHRDLKPHNVMLDDQDHVTVTDFGIARAGASDMTETGSIMGTAQYLSPEQAQGQAVAEPSDLYSIGIVLYELLTGRVPFDAESAVSIALKQVSEAPVPPVSLNPSVPPTLNQTVLWALNKNPADRPVDADQFIAVLEGVRTQILSGTAGQQTATMRAVGLGAAGAAGAAGVAGAAAALGSAGGAAAAPAATGSIPFTPAADWAQQGGPGEAGAAHAPTGTEPPKGEGHRGDDHRSSGGRAWQWALVVLVALAVAGGAVAFVLTRPHKATVPYLVNLQLAIAQARVSSAGLNPSINYESSSEASGTVIGQSPLAGARIDTGSTVTLNVSTGPGNVSVPSVIDVPLAQAKKDIAASGLTVAQIVGEPSSAIASGDIVDTSPAVGTSVTRGQAITLYVSTGSAPVSVPSVVGDTVATATSALSGAGFTVSVTNQVSSTATPGTVTAQSPSGGATAKPGTKVAITVAAAPTTASVPSVLGDTADAASAALRAAGFTVNEQRRTVTNASQSGIVVAQSPNGGATANKKSAVTIFVGHYRGGSTTTATSTTTTGTGTSTTGTSTNAVAAPSG